MLNNKATVHTELVRRGSKSAKHFFLSDILFEFEPHAPQLEKTRQTPRQKKEKHNGLWLILY